MQNIIEQIKNWDCKHVSELLPLYKKLDEADDIVRDLMSDFHKFDFDPCSEKIAWIVMGQYRDAYGKIADGIRDLQDAGGDYDWADLYDMELIHDECGDTLDALDALNNDYGIYLKTIKDVYEMKETMERMFRLNENIPCAHNFQDNVDRNRNLAVTCDENGMYLVMINGEISVVRELIQPDNPFRGRVE